MVRASIWIQLTLLYTWHKTLYLLFKFDNRFQQMQQVVIMTFEWLVLEVSSLMKEKTWLILVRDFLFSSRRTRLCTNLDKLVGTCSLFPEGGGHLIREMVDEGWELGEGDGLWETVEWEMGEKKVEENLFKENWRYMVGDGRRGDGRREGGRLERVPPANPSTCIFRFPC